MVDNSESGTDLSDEELDKYGFVSSSSRRTSLLKVLNDDVLTPKKISEKTDVHLSHVSNVLSDLSEEGLVVCVNPDRKRGRVYRLTELGEKIAQKVSE